METPGDLTREQARGFFHDLREAIATSLADSEGYMPLVQAMERMGRHLHYISSGAPVGHLTLPRLKRHLAPIAGLSSTDARHLEALFALITEARNHAVHQGGAARQLREWGVAYALALQEGLLAKIDDVTAEDIMVRNVSVAEPWHLLRDVRSKMLANSFSFMPVRIEHQWWLLEDVAIVRLLLNPEVKDRRSVLDQPVLTARESLRRAVTIPPTTRHSSIPIGHDPVLVVDSADHLLGIVAAYDLL